MARRAEEYNQRRDRTRQKASSPSGSAGEKRKPRGPLFHSGDPTLAKRLEEEVYRSER
jgi:hypothetical protein